MKEARKLAKRHRKILDNGGNGNFAALDAVRAEFLAARDALPHHLQTEFSDAYYEARDKEQSSSPSPAPASAPLEAEKEQIRCPKCNSVQFSANKAGFGLGKAVVGGALIGVPGLLGGFIGSQKVRVTCIRCGHAWDAGA